MITLVSREYFQPIAPLKLGINLPLWSFKTSFSILRLMYKLYRSYSPCCSSLHIPNSHSRNFSGLKRTKIQLLSCRELFSSCAFVILLTMCASSSERKTSVAQASGSWVRWNPGSVQSVDPWWTGKEVLNNALTLDGNISTVKCRLQPPPPPPLPRTYK